VHVTELGLEGSIPSLFCYARTNCCISSGSRSRSCVCSITSYWSRDYSSCLGLLWFSRPFDLCSYLENIYGLELYLGDTYFSFCLWCLWCCFLNNFVACWGLILPFIVVTSCLLYLFYKVSLSSSSSNQDIKIIFFWLS
jgi:hypothetical protein